MCTIERFDVLYPDGRHVPRERLVNCPRGTPARPCNNVEVKPLFEDHLATASDANPGSRSNYHAATPGGSEGSRPRMSNKNEPNGAFRGLAISFKFWNPFKSRKTRKSKGKTYLVRERPRQRDDLPTIIHPLPRAPTPPPMMPTRGRSPVIVPISPHRSPSPRHRQRPRPRPRSRERKPRRKQRKDHPPVVVHQSSSSEADKTPSPPLAAREHQRKSRSVSPRSKYEAEKKLIRDRERRAYADRVAREEQEARGRAFRAAEYERLERERQRGERIEYEQRKRIESVERAIRRQEQEEFERGEARRRQELEDIARLNAADRERQHQEELDRRRREEYEHRLEEEERLWRARRANIPRQPRHQPAIYYERESMEDRGERFIREAIRQENLRQFERRAPPNPGWPRRVYNDIGLARRNTIGDDRRRWFEGQRRRRDRRLD